MLVTGVMNLIKIVKEGTCENGNKYMRISAVSFDKDEQYLNIVVFNGVVDYIKRNLVDTAGEFKPRRAFVSGQLSVKEYAKEIEIKRNIILDGEKKGIKFIQKVPAYSLDCLADTVQFIDAKKRNDIEFTDINEKQDIVVEEE